MTVPEHREVVVIHVTFLGTGGAFSSGERSPLALLIESGEWRMLVDTGPVIMEQLARAGLKATDISQLFVSHGHGDHTLGFPMLALNRLEAESPLHVYAGSSTIASLHMLSALSFSSLVPDGGNVEWHKLSEEGPDEIPLAPGVQLRTCVVEHPPSLPTLSARWDFDGGPTITFITDTRPGRINVELARESDLLIHEASFSATLQPDAEPAQHYHSTAAQAGEIAREAACKRLALVHLGPEIGRQPDVLVEEARGGTDLDVIVPDDGQRLTVD